MDLAYLQTGIRGVFFLDFEFQESVFLGVMITAAVFFGSLNKNCILNCFIFSTVFFWVQFYSPGA